MTVIILVNLCMQIAIEGCCHGDLDKIYSTLQHLESRQRNRIDLLICCGDFQVRSGNLHSSSSQILWEHSIVIEHAQCVQAVRNLDDLECLACPPKYRDLKSFYKYYTGQLEAPIPTLFSEPSITCSMRLSCYNVAMSYLHKLTVASL